MELAVAALGSLLPKLGTLISDEYKLQKGVRGEIKFLKAEMEWMQAILVELSERPPDQIRELDKFWARDLKELSYDIEDSVDTYKVQIDAPVSDKPQGQPKPHSFRKFIDKTMGLFKKPMIRHHVADDIQDIKKRIREVGKRRRNYKIEGVAARPDTSAVDSRVLACFEDAAKLVGTYVPVQEISNLLTEENGAHKEKTMVVSIVGVGGLGKTTVANLVYERLRRKFDCHAFVPVSLRPNMNQILRSILRQVSIDECKNSGEKETHELIRDIRESLEGKRYFIVIDDVWSAKAWETIKCAFIDNRYGNRVIVTTRNIDVAKYTSVDGAMYELDPLSRENSKKLLSKRIFNEEEGILPELEEVTEKILNKCGGIPLAIITTASMLAGRKNQTNFEWYSVYKSMGSGLEKDKSLESMREILHLSYCDLPSHLKPCLLYLSMFPEDYEIPREQLIRLWVAEGFVDDGVQGSNLYEVGEGYFNKLVNRSMIQPVDIDELGTARACRVHDMILDLIISLSAQENFATVSEGTNMISPAGKIRRLSLQGNDSDSVEEKVLTTNVSQVRTVIPFGDAFKWMPSLSEFSVLRVLVLKCFWRRNNNLKGLGNLHQLRYLQLQSYDVQTEHLEGIGNLKHLKTLDLRGMRIREFPACIVKLTQLENLIIRSGVTLPDGIGGLVSLQRLETLGAKTSPPHTLAELGNLTDLRVLKVSLRVCDETDVKTFLRSLSNLHNIRTLNISRGSYFIDLDCIPVQWSCPARLQRFDGGFSKLPRWFSHLSELSYLSIWVEKLRQDDLQVLGTLPMLRSLDLCVDVSDCITEERLVVDQPFRALTNFKFRNCRRYWPAFACGAMPKLLRLELHFKARQRAGSGFHVGMENLASLKKIKIKVDCWDARITDVEAAEAECRDVVNNHPNHPTLELSRVFESRMKEEESEEERQ